MQEVGVDQFAGRCFLFAVGVLTAANPPAHQWFDVAGHGLGNRLPESFNQTFVVIDLLSQVVVTAGQRRVKVLPR